MNYDRDETHQFACSGSMFVKPGQKSYNLFDLKISGPTTKGNARNNYLQFYATGIAAKFDKARAYYYFGGKWFVRTGTNFTNDPEASDFTIDAGTGFLCSFMHATSKILYSGEVVTGGATKTLSVSRNALDSISGYQFFIANNPSATDITLSDVTITGPTTKGNARNNYLQFFATGIAAKFDKTRAYYYFGGKWWSRTGTNFTNDPEVPNPGDIKIRAGEGFLCSFMHTTTELNFPTSL